MRLCLLIAVIFFAKVSSISAKQEIYGIFLTMRTEDSWKPTESLYFTLIEKYGVPKNNLRVMNLGTKLPATNSHIIYSNAFKDSVKSAFHWVAGQIKEEDVFFFLLEGHGGGYIGRDSLDRENRLKYGTVPCNSPPRIANEGEPWEFIESEFEFGHDYGSTAMLYVPYGNIHCGIDKWCERTFRPDKDGGICLRIMVKSHYTDLELENGTFHSDNDSLLEVVLDFALGDFNKNGIIEFELGETCDLNGDGKCAYDPYTGEFDEAEWGLPDSIIDDFPEFIRNRCGIRYVLYDAGLDNRMNIDWNPTGPQLTVDGTDIDGDGVIDGVDINGDGDKDDKIVLRSDALLYGSSTLYDDSLRHMFDLIKQGTKIALINSCQGGGFLNNLSAESTIVITGGNPSQFVGQGALPRAVAAALGDSSDIVDVDGDGAISMLELFNSASYLDMRLSGTQSWKFYRKMFILDDNGDMVGHLHPLPDITGDGIFSSTVLLRPVDKTNTQLATKPRIPGSFPLTWTRNSAGIQFSTAPGAAITIYALDGRRVATLTTNAGGTAAWPRANAGVYMVAAEIPGKRSARERLCVTGR